MGATLRPGTTVVLVNLSMGGALVHSERLLHPRSRVQSQLGSPLVNATIAARVLRCSVAAIGAGGVTYSAALKFDVPCELPWEPQRSEGWLTSVRWRRFGPWRRGRMKAIDGVALFCPLSTATIGKRPQAATQRQGSKSLRPPAIATFSGNVRQPAAKGG